MVLILSNLSDHSTNEVIKWLMYWNIPFFRVNYIDEFLEYDVSLCKNGEIKAFPKCSTLPLVHEISCVWFRRPPETKQKSLNKEQCEVLEYESHTLYNYILYLFKDLFWLNHPMYSRVNKLHVLHEASNIGLKIPDTLVTTQKDSLLDFYLKNHSNIITKPIYEVKTIHNSQKEKLSIQTHLLDKKILNILDEKFHPSLVQKNIKKRTEIRTVYLNGEFYSMAILSQKNEKTKIDFRNYDYSYPNRMIPFQLPVEIEQKLSLLMDKLFLNFASIDLIYSNNKEFVFLEVNPVGQFGMTSTPTNYKIEHKVAELLKDKHYAHEKN